MEIKSIDLNVPSETDNTYYTFVLVCKNGHTRKTIKPNDGNYDILRFQNYGCYARVEDYVKEKYNIGNYRSWDFIIEFFNGTDPEFNKENCYKKYQKFFV